jgi:competence protein ComEC
VSKIRRKPAVWLALAVATAAVALGGCGSPGGASGSVATGASQSPPAAISSQPAGLSPSPSATRSPRAQSAGTVVITFVDVGQGDGVVIKAGSWSGLVDGGTAGNEGAVAAVLAQLGVRRLDALVVTHPHADHIGDLPSLVQTYRPRVAYLDAKASTKAYRSLMSALRTAGTRLATAFRGQTLAFGSLHARVLSPGKTLSGDANADSIVLLLVANGRGVLLTGDVAGAAETAVGDALARGPPVYLLKVAHHGSRTSTSAAFLADVRARFAVISVGVNSYGHPSPKTLARLGASGTHVYTTKADGSITVTFSAAGAVRWSFGRPAD